MFLLIYEVTSIVVASASIVLFVDAGADVDGEVVADLGPDVGFYVQIVTVIANPGAAVRVDGQCFADVVVVVESDAFVDVVVAFDVEFSADFEKFVYVLADVPMDVEVVVDVVLGVRVDVEVVFHVVLGVLGNVEVVEYTLLDVRMDAAADITADVFS